MCVLCAGFVPTVAHAALSDSLLLTLDQGEIEGNRVEIVATLTKNSGAVGLLLTLDYDDNALELVDVTEGKALAGLSCTRTATYTTPYTILYMKMDNFYKNDTSTGVLLKFVFEIKDVTRDGVYKITLKAEKNGVQYADSDQFKTKNLLSNPTTITVVGEQPTVDILPVEEPTDADEPDDTTDETPQDSHLLPILISVAAAIVLVVAFAVILALKKGKSKRK